MLSRLIGKCKSQSRKRLKEIFKIWIQGILATHLATHSWVSWVAKNASFSKLFTFPCITCLSLCLLHLSLSQNRFLYSKNLNFSLQFSLQIQEKVWVFTPFYFISSLKHYISWICCFCWDIEILLMNMGFCCFWWNWYMCFVENNAILLVFHVSIKTITCSCIIQCFVLWCAYHFIDKMSI